MFCKSSQPKGSCFIIHAFPKPQTFSILANLLCTLLFQKQCRTIRTLASHKQVFTIPNSSMVALPCIPPPFPPRALIISRICDARLSRCAAGPEQTAMPCPGQQPKRTPSKDNPCTWSISSGWQGRRQAGSKNRHSLDHKTS